MPCTIRQPEGSTEHGRNPDLLSLTPAEASTWNQALEYYERKIAGRDFLDFEMITIDKTLAGADDAGLHGVPRYLAPPLAEILRRGAPVYRAHWWTEHDHKNREWVEGVTPLIARYEKTLRPALAHAYNTPWPKKRILVEYEAGHSLIQKGGGRNRRRRESNRTEIVAAGPLARHAVLHER